MQKRKKIQMLMTENMSGHKAKEIIDFLLKRQYGKNARCNMHAVEKHKPEGMRWIIALKDGIFTLSMKVLSFMHDSKTHGIEFADKPSWEEVLAVLLGMSRCGHDIVVDGGRFTRSTTLLERNTTLEQIFIEMDLNEQNLQTLI